MGRPNFDRDVPHANLPGRRAATGGFWIVRVFGFRFSWIVLRFGERLPVAQEAGALFCSTQGWAGVSNARARSGTNGPFLFNLANLDVRLFESGLCGQCTGVWPRGSYEESPHLGRVVWNPSITIRTIGCAGTPSCSGNRPTLTLQIKLASSSNWGCNSALLRRVPGLVPPTLQPHGRMKTSSVRTLVVRCECGQGPTSGTIRSAARVTVSMFRTLIMARVRRPRSLACVTSCSVARATQRHRNRSLRRGRRIAKAVDCFLVLSQGSAKSSEEVVAKSRPAARRPRWPLQSFGWISPSVVAPLARTCIPKTRPASSSSLKQSEDMKFSPTVAPAEGTEGFAMVPSGPI